MNRHLRYQALALAVTAHGLTGQSTPSDRTELLARFEHHASQLQELVGGLSPRQWRFKPAADRWSVAEVVEHIVANEEWTYGIMIAGLAERVVTDEDRRAAMQQEDLIRATLQDRSQRFSAPPNLEPTGRYGSDGSQLLKAFRQHRRAWTDFLRSADFDLRSRVAPHPILGTVDTRLWVVAAVEHGDRHLAQIREVMANPSFPQH